MGNRMELVAGDLQEILVHVGTGDRDALRDPARFGAWLSLSGMDPTWLDLFAEAARVTTDTDGPRDFLDARIEVAPSDDATALTVERVDPTWVRAVAAIPDAALDGVAGRWIDRLDDEIGPLGSEEKPWIRELVGQLVVFCRQADRHPDVVFLWELS